MAEALLEGAKSLLSRVPAGALPVVRFALSATGERWLARLGCCGVWFCFYMLERSGKRCNSKPQSYYPFSITDTAMDDA